MKIGFYCESPADRAALEIFVAGILGEPLEPINLDLEAHSVPGFFNTLAGVFRGIHYNSDAEGFVVVVDCDDTELHDVAHDAPASKEDRCRYCRIRGILNHCFPSSERLRKMFDTLLPLVYYVTVTHGAIRRLRRG